jgi:endoplasmic reticulum chaperone BiP
MIKILLIVAFIVFASCEPSGCPVIGIDLGMTSSCVGIYINGQVFTVPNELGNSLTPTVVAFTDDEILIGEAAKDQAI